MKRVCFDKRTAKVINDFQSNASEGLLIDNAVRAGLGSAENFEERIVSDEEYTQLEQETNQATKEQIAQQAEAERIKKEQDIQSAKDKLKGLGLTDNEAAMLF